MIEEETTDPIDAYLCHVCGERSWYPTRIEGCIDDCRIKDPTYFFLAYFECRNCKETRVIKFVGAKPNIVLSGDKKIVRPDIESEEAIESSRKFFNAVKGY